MDISQQKIYANAHLVAKNLIEGTPGRYSAIHQAVADMIASHGEALMVSGLESGFISDGSDFFSGSCGQRH